MASLIGLSSDRATVSYSSADHNGTDGFGKGIFIGSNDAVVTYTMANHNEDEGLLVHAAAPRSIITFSSFNQNGLDGIRVDATTRESHGARLTTMGITVSSSRGLR